jgi:pimeloyl-ACP methyl ester carboxylesterase
MLRPCNTLDMVVAIARPKLEGNVAVGDDRQLGFAEFGDPQGRAVFWLHGTPGARRQIPTEARIFAERNGIRLIGTDRPGIGSSTPFQYDNVVAFADDLATVADTLGVDKMAIVGLSGGGPYTLGCAAALPDRIVTVGVLGGVAPTRGADAVGGGVVALSSYVAPLLERAGLPIRLAAVALIWMIRVTRRRSASAGAARVQGDVSRRSPQRQSQTTCRPVRRRRRVRSRLGIPARAGEGPGQLVARRPRPHRAVRAR